MFSIINMFPVSDYANIHMFAIQVILWPMARLFNLCWKEIEIKTKQKKGQNKFVLTLI